jgi:hypothetical protein
MKSYLYLGGTSEALNMGPLVLWTDKSNGIAFSFAYRSRAVRNLAVRTIIVFRPNSILCEEDTIIPEPEPHFWRQLAPDSLGAASDEALETLQNRR